MLDTLLESKATQSRRGRGAALSAMAHVIVVTLAIIGTGRQAARGAIATPTKDTMLVYHPPRPSPPTPTLRGSASTTTTRSAGPIFPLPDVTQIRVGVPPIDPIAITRTLDVSRELGSERVPGARADSAGSGGHATGAQFLWQVDKPTVPLPGNPMPRYPELLRAAGVEGEALVEFVVDTAGHIEPRSVRILRSSHDLFTDAVRATLPSLRFLPAEAGGRKVRQVVQLPFEFSIR